MPSRERAQTKLAVDNREFTATAGCGLRSLAKSWVLWSALLMERVGRSFESICSAYSLDPLANRESNPSMTQRLLNDTMSVWMCKSIFLVRKMPATSGG